MNEMNDSVLLLEQEPHRWLLVEVWSSSREEPPEEKNEALTPRRSMCWGSLVGFVLAAVAHGGGEDVTGGTRTRATLACL